MIHGRPTERILGSSGGPEFLLCDYGCEINGYNSDLTRTFVVNGEPTARQREIYDVVKAAQLAALEAIKPGVIGKDVDAAARNIITAAGFGNNFNHGLGHGLGRLVHDQYGVFNATSELVIREGMVVTVEPGIYLDGWGGVRIEDDVLVTATGYDVLTHSTKEMVIL
jgi:Xaa-Pro aminopeptidase